MTYPGFRVTDTLSHTEQGDKKEGQSYDGYGHNASEDPREHSHAKESATTYPQTQDDSRQSLPEFRMRSRRWRRRGIPLHVVEDRVCSAYDGGILEEGVIVIAHASIVALLNEIYKVNA
jgi:hypothetical protein